MKLAWDLTNKYQSAHTKLRYKEYGKIRWEFCRRNIQYEQDFNEFLSENIDFNEFLNRWSMPPTDPNTSADNLCFRSISNPLKVIGWSGEKFGPKLFKLYYHSDTPRLFIGINMGSSKTEILKNLGDLIDFFKKEFKEKFPQFSKKSYIIDGRKLDIKQYKKYLEVWDLRKEKKSWNQIKEIAKLDGLQNARDYYNAARKCIKEGIPGFSPFPTTRHVK